MKGMDKATEMLLGGATLVAEPCPYCGGVRVLSNGDAMCVSCSSEPPGAHPDAARPVSGSGQSAPEGPPMHEAGSDTGTFRAEVGMMESKLRQLVAELAAERDHRRQLDILESIRSLLDVTERLRGLDEMVHARAGRDVAGGTADAGAEQARLSGK